MSSNLAVDVSESEQGLESNIEEYLRSQTETEETKPEDPGDPNLLYEWIVKSANYNLSAHNRSPIFKVHLAKSPNDVFLEMIPTKYRQKYTCHACHHFMNKYGRLALANEDGMLVPLFWKASGSLPGDSRVPEFFRMAVSEVRWLFSGRKVTREFKVTNKNKRMGVHTSKLTHICFEFSAGRMQEEAPGFTAPPTKKLAAILSRLLRDHRFDTIRKTADIFRKNDLPYTENFREALDWLFTIAQEAKDRRIIEKGEDRARNHNILYRLAAMSFRNPSCQGYLRQLRSGPLATLLDDIQANRSWISTQIQWNRVCKSDNYLRRLRNIGLTPRDLKRQYSSMSNLPDNVYIWRWITYKKTRRAHPDSGEDISGVNAGILAFSPPVTPITFSKFVIKVLPDAVNVEVKLSAENPLYFILTGLPGTKPLMKWHDNTNLASWMTYATPKPFKEHNLEAGTWNEVKAIIPFPHLWDGIPATTTFPIARPDDEKAAFKPYHLADGFRYLVCLEGVRDSGSSLCLFPDFLKPEFAASSAIAKNSNELKCSIPEDIETSGGGFVGGIRVDRSNTTVIPQLKFRVTSCLGKVELFKVNVFE